MNKYSTATTRRRSPVLVNHLLGIQQAAGINHKPIDRMGLLSAMTAVTYEVYTWCH